MTDDIYETKLCMISLGLDERVLQQSVGCRHELRKVCLVPECTQKGLTRTRSRDDMNRREAPPPLVDYSRRISNGRVWVVCNVKSADRVRARKSLKFGHSSARF
mmetsp:Transcript_45639/g.106662  ORF Transcript_45639/g.106662 Transcript_45639/m.106662 type:complete len:104 (-) Transcript_45639:482-793(-)